MRFFYLLASLATFALVFSSSLPAQPGSERKSDESVQFATFKGDYGGHAYELTGPFDQVMAELKGRYPEAQHAKRSESIVSERQWSNAEIPSNVAVGPSQCQLIWCNSMATIDICNNNNYALSIEADIVAQRIQDIISGCPQTCLDNIACGVGGQVFDTANWNLVLKGGAEYACPAGRLVKDRALSLEGPPEADALSESELPRGSVAAARRGDSTRSKPAHNPRFVPRMEPVTFKGVVYGGHVYELNGTVTEVNAKLKELYPDVQLSPQEKRDLFAPLESRDPILPCLCVPVRGQPWANSNQPSIQGAVNELSNHDHMVWVGANSCGLVWCDDDPQGSSIILCQHTPAVDLGSKTIAGVVIQILQQCGHKVGPSWPSGQWIQAGGQQFDSDVYNVILKGSYTPGGGIVKGGCGSGW